MMYDTCGDIEEGIRVGGILIEEVCFVIDESDPARYCKN